MGDDRYTWEGADEFCFTPRFEMENRPGSFLQAHIHAKGPTRKAAMISAQLHWLLLLKLATGLPVRFRADM
jgi:hypothetical protein